MGLQFLLIGEEWEPGVVSHVKQIRDDGGSGGPPTRTASANNARCPPGTCDREQIPLRRNGSQGTAGVNGFQPETGCDAVGCAPCTRDVAQPLSGTQRRVFTIRASNAKSRKLRSVPLNDAAVSVLNRLDRGEAGDSVFLSGRTGTAFTAIDKQWKRVREAAGLPHLRLHDLRHSFASFLVNDGRTLYEVQNRPRTTSAWWLCGSGDECLPHQEVPRSLVFRGRPDGKSQFTGNSVSTNAAETVRGPPHEWVRGFIKRGNPHE
ncbi:MAG: tyrosine-type recombinase/integrase [Proteobacteria bacterium]|nr:tyrosine-type recombinase/integrase [Pseudomonadota bacterium]